MRNAMDDATSRGVLCIKDEGTCTWTPTIMLELVLVVLEIVRTLSSSKKDTKAQMSISCNVMAIVALHFMHYNNRHARILVPMSYCEQWCAA